MTHLIKSLMVGISLAALSACADSAPTNTAPETPLQVQLIGGPTTVLQYGETTILTDPTFDPAGGRYDIKFAVLEKTQDPVLPVSDLPDIDLVLLSHDQHGDNFDPAGRDIAAKAPLTITTLDGASRLEGSVIGLDWWDTQTVGDIVITAVPAQHGPSGAVATLGTVNGFVISSEAGPTIYVSGDTVPFEGTDMIIEALKGKIDYALLHTGAVGRGETYFTMKAEQAVDFAERLDVKAFSIIHTDSWAHFTEDFSHANNLAQSSVIADRYIDLSDKTRKTYSFGR